MALSIPRPCVGTCQPTPAPAAPDPARSAKFHRRSRSRGPARPRLIPAHRTFWAGHARRAAVRPLPAPPTSRPSAAFARRATLRHRPALAAPAGRPAGHASSFALALGGPHPSLGPRFPGGDASLGGSARKFFFVHKLAASDRLVTGMMNLRFPRPVPNRRQVVHRWPCGSQQHGQVVPRVFHSFAHRHVDCLRRPCHRAGDEAPAEQRPSLCKGKAERGNGPKGVSLHVTSKAPGSPAEVALQITISVGPPSSPSSTPPWRPSDSVGRNLRGRSAASTRPREQHPRRPGPSLPSSPSFRSGVSTKSRLPRPFV